LIGFGIDFEEDAVVEEALGAGDGGGFGAEVGEAEFEVGAAGFEAIEEFAGDGCGVGDGEFGAVGVEDLHEAAHVGAFVLVGEVDRHGDGGDGVLGAKFAVGDGEGELDAADADAVDGEAAVVEFGLGVGEAHGGGEKEKPHCHQEATVGRRNIARRCRDESAKD
jgi:hypothetical protein